MRRFSNGSTRWRKSVGGRGGGGWRAASHNDALDEVTGPCTIAWMPVVLHPRLTLAAESCPTLAYMIQNGLPLNRETWIGLSWGGHSPKLWCIEHEIEVPEFWRDADKVDG